MKAGTSSLNPYAASYVPLNKRGPTNANNEFSRGQEELNTGNEAVWFGHQQNINSPPHQKSYGQTAAAEVCKRKDTHGGEFFASTSQYHHHHHHHHYNDNVMQQNNFDEEFDMDLAYLQMTFPGMSDESLSDVYLANTCDLDAAVDMLNQLDQIYPDDSMDKLPDTLDIGDVPESVSVAGSQKLVKKTGASTSSSAS